MLHEINCGVFQTKLAHGYTTAMREFELAAAGIQAADIQQHDTVSTFQLTKSYTIDGEGQIHTVSVGKWQCHFLACPKGKLSKPHFPSLPY